MRWIAVLGAVWALAGCSAGGLDAQTPPEHQHAHDTEYPATPGDHGLPLKNAEPSFARFQQARWYTRGRSAAIDRIVIHTTEGRYDGTISWFQSANNNYHTSAHFVIRSSDGEITQMVREADTAHHVRGNNARSIGIEHEAFVAESSWYTEAMYQSSARLVRYLCTKHGIPCDRAHIKGHFELDPDRRVDPGHHWDWDRYMALVNDTSAAPEVPEPPPFEGAACDFRYWNCAADRLSRMRCDGGRVVEVQACIGGCQVMPVGQHDLCRPDAAESFGACTIGEMPGTCMDVAVCQGDSTPGYCPGGNEIQCCTAAPEPPAEDPPGEDPPGEDPPSEDPPPVDGPAWVAHARGLSLGGSEIPRQGLANRTLAGVTGEAVEPYGDVETLHGRQFVSGLISHFGGPDDRGVTADETGAITGERLRSLNTPMNPSARDLRDRPEDFYFIALRFNYTPNGRAFWRDQRILVVDPASGRGVVTRPVDWGPHTRTRRVVDVSPETVEALGVSTDDRVLISFASPNTPLGPVTGGAPVDPPVDPPIDPPLDGEGEACVVDGEAGECMRTSRCGGTATPGHCPGPNQVQCCVEDAPPVDPEPAPEPDPVPEAEPPNGIWQPAPGTSWQWQLTGGLDTSYDVSMYDIDLFDVSANTIDRLHADGRVVICYFSAGSHENWRDDANDFPAAALGNALDGWAGERWIDVRDAGVRAVMAARLDLAVAKGCDGVEPDNVDGYDNQPGFNFNGGHQLDYNRWLAAEAHARGLSIGLKNDLEQVRDLVGHFDWALNEECAAWNECDALTPFIDAGKAVFHVEYSGNTATICRTSDRLSFDTLIKRMDLDAWRQTCD